MTNLVPCAWKKNVKFVHFPYQYTVTIAESPTRKCLLPRQRPRRVVFSFGWHWQDESMEFQPGLEDLGSWRWKRQYQLSCSWYCLESWRYVAYQRLIRAAPSTLNNSCLRIQDRVLQSFVILQLYHFIRCKMAIAFCRFHSTCLQMKNRVLILQGSGGFEMKKM